MTLTIGLGSVVRTSFVAGLTERLAVTAILLAPLGACSSSSLYFHNDAYQQATAEVKSDVDKLDVAAAFTNLATQSESLARDEDQAAVTAVVALRNRMLVRLVDPSDGDWLIEAPVSSHFRKNAAAARLERLIADDLRILKTKESAAAATDYIAGGRMLLAYQNLVNAADAATSVFRELVRQAIELEKVQPAPAINCATAAEIAAGGGTGLPDLTAEAYRNLARACQDTEARDAFIGKFVEKGMGAEGTISRAARNYLEALQTMEEANKTAISFKNEVAALLKAIKAPDANLEKLSEDLEKLIARVNNAGALARLLSFKEIDAFLECGLIANLEAAKEELAKADGPEGAGSKCDQVFLGKDGNAALAGVIKAMMGAIKDSVSVERLALINASILALADMRQRLATAEVTVAFLERKLQLYRAQLVALLDQYRLLSAAQKSLERLPDDPIQGFVELRGKSDYRRDMAEALSAYVASWNYGRIPAEAIDFRFIQARRAHDIQLASITAANHKAVVAPIADALAAYGQGGITPDTLATVISNLGILSGIVFK